MALAGELGPRGGYIPGGTVPKKKRKKGKLTKTGRQALRRAAKRAPRRKDGTFKKGRRTKKKKR